MLYRVLMLWLILNELVMLALINYAMRNPWRNSMAKTYSLQGPIFLETLSNTDALAFCAAVIDAIPSYSMGTASLNIQAQGPAGTASPPPIKGASVEELKASLEAAEAAPKAPEDIIYDIRGRVNLVALTFADGVGVIEAVLNAIPEDSLVMTAMLAQEC